MQHIIFVSILFGFCQFASGALPSAQSPDRLPESQKAPLIYKLQFEITLKPGADTKARIALAQPAAYLREVRFTAPEDRFFDFQGSGSITRDQDQIIWRPPSGNGELTYSTIIDHQRNDAGFDALITDQWAIFRAEDIFPPAKTRQLKGSMSQSTLSFSLPDNWSVRTPYERNTEHSFVVDHPARKFDRPAGWMIAGKLGVRRDIIHDINVAIAAPKHSGVQRIPMLALLRWTLPLIAAEVDQLPDHILIVSGNDPMWRGGLSGPNSAYVHGDRPLISENGTSTLLHELVHVLMPIPTAREHDWIDEGIAEYLALSLLKHSGSISELRFKSTIEQFTKRGRKASSLRGVSATGAVRARAVSVFNALDQELRKHSDNQVTLFTLTRRLMLEQAPIDLKRLNEISSELVGADQLKALSNLPLQDAN